MWRTGWAQASVGSARTFEAAAKKGFDPLMGARPMQRLIQDTIRKALAEADWLDIPALAQSAAHLAEAEGVMIWAAQREWQERVEVGEGEIRYRPLAPPAIRLRVVLRAIALLSGDARGGSVAKLMKRLALGKDSNLAGVIARTDGQCWTFRKEPPRRLAGEN